MGNDLERAGEHLERAEHELETARSLEDHAREDLKKAEAAEQAALKDIKEAINEVHEAAEHQKIIHFLVDGEPYETRAKHLTPNDILKDFAGRDPADYYLVRIEGSSKESYQGKGDIPIEMKDGMRFQAVYSGVTPVSDDTGARGHVAFRTGLEKLGFSPRSVPGTPNALEFDYPVESGRFAGTTVRLGFVVPDDFPESTPTGPHVSPMIRPLNPSGVHPDGAIHAEHARPFLTCGGEWQYWSRPFVPTWAAQRKSVATYMGHIWRLWETQ